MSRAKSSTAGSADGDSAQEGSGSPGRPAVLGARAKTASRPGMRSAPASPQPAGGTATPQPSQRGGTRTSQTAGKTMAVTATTTSPSSQSGSMRQPHDIQYYRERLLEIYKAHNSANVSRVDFLLDKYKGQEEFLYRTVCAKYNRPIDLPTRSSTSAALASTATTAAGSSSAAASARATDTSGAKSAISTTTTRAKAVLPKPPAKTLPSASRTATTPASASGQTGTAGQGGHSGRNGAAGNHAVSVSSATASSASASTTAIVPATSSGKGNAEALGKVSALSLTNGVASGAYNTQLLREIDFLLLDEVTGFFADDDGGESSGTSSDLVSESSASEDEEAATKQLALARATGPHPATTAKLSGSAAARPASARPAAPKQLALTAPAGTAAKLPPARTSDAPRAVSGASKVQPAASSAPLAKSSNSQTTAQKNQERLASQTSKPAPARETSAPAPSPDEEAQEDELDLDDADLGAALAANLVGAPPEKEEADVEAAAKTTKSARPPSPKAKAKPPPALSSRGEKRDAPASTSAIVPSARLKKDGAPSVAAPADSEKPGAPASTKAKAAWGAPPPLRGRTLNGAKPKAPPAAAEKKPQQPPPEAPPPSIFEQWLAILKMLTGWNDQKSYKEDQIRSHVREHLSNEGIVEQKTVERLCNCLVPMMSKLRPVDKMIVKNVKADILRGAKIIQISFLRVVAYELMQEQDAKATLAAQKKKDAKSAGPSGGNGAGSAYLSKDMYGLLKVLTHFKFEKGFQLALKNLIMSIRSQKGPPSKSDSATDGKAKKRKAAEASDALDAAGSKEKNSEEGGTAKGGALKRRKASN